MTLVKVAETSEIPLGQMKLVKLAEKEVLIANVNDVYYAIGNICTHMRGDLSKGTLEGNTGPCPQHKAKFDVTTARADDRNQKRNSRLQCDAARFPSLVVFVHRLCLFFWCSSSVRLWLVG